MNELDPRIVKVSIEVDGSLKTYEGLAISATGTKFGNENQNEAEIKISNLDKTTRNYILTETSPFNENRKPKKIILEVGRLSSGTFKLFEGDITASTITQPPDITLVMKALTGDFAKGDVVAVTQAPQVKLSKIAEQIAGSLGLSLEFQATDKNIANYSFNGGKLKQIAKLGEAGYVNAFIDDNVLVVKDWDAPLRDRVRVLNLGTGMIGIPEINEQGVKVKFLIDNQTVLGGAIKITSELNPAANGTYDIYKLDFDVTSRDIPFYFIAEAKRLKENV